MNGDGANAIRWLDRAHRLAPDDGTLTLTLASACLRHDNVRAAALFRKIAEAEDVRSAWLGLAAARLSLGDAAGAADALAEALARHVPDAALRSARNSVADMIASQSGSAGWCGIAGDGQIVVRPAISGTAEIRLDGHKLALLKPETFMNESGQSVGAAARFFKLDPGAVLVVHDEGDLERGRLQLRLGGGLGGHNGLRSVAQHLKTQDFLRLRVGVGRPGRGDPRPLADYVLADFEPHDDVDSLIWNAAQAVEKLDAEGIQRAQADVNGR